MFLANLPVSAQSPSVSSGKEVPISDVAEQVVESNPTLKSSIEPKSGTNFVSSLDKPENFDPSDSRNEDTTEPDHTFLAELSESDTSFPQIISHDDALVAVEQVVEINLKPKSTKNKKHRLGRPPVSTKTSIEKQRSLQQRQQKLKGGNIVKVSKDGSPVKKKSKTDFGTSLILERLVTPMKMNVNTNYVEESEKLKKKSEEKLLNRNASKTVKIIQSDHDYVSEPPESGISLSKETIESPEKYNENDLPFAIESKSIFEQDPGTSSTVNVDDGKVTPLENLESLQSHNENDFPLETGTKSTFENVPGTSSTTNVENRKVTPLKIRVKSNDFLLMKNEIKREHKIPDESNQEIKKKKRKSKRISVKCKMCGQL